MVKSTPRNRSATLSTSSGLSTWDGIVIIRRIYKGDLKGILVSGKHGFIKMTGRALEVRSDKSLTLLTFDFWHFKFEHLNIWRLTFDHLNIWTLQHCNIGSLEHWKIWNLEYSTLDQYFVTSIALILFKRLRATFVTSIASMDWVKIQNVVGSLCSVH